MTILIVTSLLRIRWGLHAVVFQCSVTFAQRRRKRRIFSKLGYHYHFTRKNNYATFFAEVNLWKRLRLNPG